MKQTKQNASLVKGRGTACGGGIVKKSFSILLAICMLLSVTSGMNIIAFAATEGYYTYSVVNGEATITSCDANISGDITIPSTLGGYPLTGIASFAFLDCNNLTGITIPDSVTYIDEAAFSGCSSLEEMTIPFVGSSADATSASSSTLFGYIFGTSSYNGGTSARQYYSLSAAYPYDYVIYYIPSSLRSVTVTGGNILHGAFNDCKGLTSVIIPNNITSISYEAFMGCTNLTNITIPNSVGIIYDWAFAGCKNLINITIPNSVGYIGMGAFSGCKSLIDLIIPNSSIGYMAFYGCDSLTNLTIGNGAKTIDTAAFAGCKSLTSVTIPDSVTSIGPSVFEFCTSLTNVKIGAGVTIIENDMFYGCTSLTSITIPDSVTSIGESVFDGCDNLTDVYFAGTEEEWNAIMADADSEALSNATVHYYNYVAPLYDVNALGGSIRISDAGLRFGFSFNEQEGVEVEEYGFVYSYSELYNFNIATPGTKNMVATNRVTHEDGTTTFNLVFVNIPKDAYGSVISARAYVKIGGKYYYSRVLRRSFLGVSQAVLADSSVDASIKEALNKLLDEMRAEEEEL